MPDFLEFVVPLEPSAVAAAVTGLLKSGPPRDAVPSDAIIDGAVRQTEFNLYCRNGVLSETAAICHGEWTKVGGGTRIKLWFERRRVLRRARRLVAISTIVIFSTLWWLSGTGRDMHFSRTAITLVALALLMLSGLLLVVEGSAIQTECGATFTALKLTLEEAVRRQGGASWSFPKLEPVAVR
jgi:hypothetical protein